jgi:hypothetical protein
MLYDNKVTEIKEEETEKYQGIRGIIQIKRGGGG